MSTTICVRSCKNISISIKAKNCPAFSVLGDKGCGLCIAYGMGDWPGGRLHRIRGKETREPAVRVQLFLTFWELLIFIIVVLWGSVVVIFKSSLEGLAWGRKIPPAEEKKQL